MDNNINCAEADGSFGPTIPDSCRGGFDFTLRFELIFLSSIPAVILLLAGSFRIWQLSHAQAVVHGPILQISKQCALVSYGITQLVTLVFWTRPSIFKLHLSVASAVLVLLTTLLMSPLSFLEGQRSLRPSPILNIYLLVSTLFDTAQVRTLWLIVASISEDNLLRYSAISFSLGLGLKFVILVLEALPKKIRNSEEVLSREKTCGVYSLRTFWWLNRILWLGRRKRIQSSDLYTIDPGLKNARYSAKLMADWRKVHSSNKYGLLRAVFSTLKWPLLMPAFPRLILIGFNFAQPLLLKRTLKYVEEPEGSYEKIGYGLIGATVAVYSGLAIFNGYYGHLLYRSIILVRGSLIDIIYRKSLTIELSVAQEAAPVGLVTADVERIDFTIEKLHSLWASVVELAIGIFLLQIEVGWACIAPVIVAIICTVATSYITKLLPSRQRKWNQSVQQRVSLTSTMLSNMKTVKMMAFSKYIETTLQAARMTELAASGGFRKFMAVINTIVMVPKQMSTPFTLTLFILAVYKGSGEGRLTASTAFTTISLIEIITTPLGLLLQTLPSMTASLACLDRIQTYLRSPDRVDQRTTEDLDSGCRSMEKLEIRSSQQSDLPIISFRQTSIAYHASKNCVLNAVSLTVPQGSITMVAGPVGSGKSSLLKAILGELDLQMGELYVRPGRMAYCDQNPWIPNGSIQDCIIGESDSIFDSSWYDEVVHSCALGQDISSLKDGANTRVGSRGIALSEGQKHRLALARAIYSRLPLLLLDDVLRSLDSPTQTLISTRLLSPTGLLKRYGMTAVFATNSAHHLPLADQIIVLDKDGQLVQTGNFHNLNACEGYIRSLSIQKSIFEIESSPVSIFPGPKDIKEQKQPSKKIPPNSNETKVIGTQDKGTYRFYFGPIGVLRIGILVAAVVLLSFATRFQRIWVELWTKDYGHQSMYIGVLFLLAVVACLSFMFFFLWMFMFVVPVTAGGLHEQLLHSILHAPLSYFTTNDSGVILNRFSQDMAILNGQLPITLFQAASVAMMGLSQIALIAYGSKYMAVAIPVTLFALWLLSHYYLLTSQQLRILELELKAPIYTSLTETKEGLATVRAFGWQSSYTRDFETRVDDSKKAIYMLFMVQRWLNFVLDLIVLGLATVLVTLATQLRHSTDAAELGVGLSSVIGFNMLASQFIVTYTELENSLGAVTRIKNCVKNIKSEDEFSDNQQPPHNWPSNGGVDFVDVSAAYGDEENLALRNVTFRALPGQKVLICGRTGSGKSTLISALLRLIDLQTGSKISIDGIDISTLSAEAVRRSITVIPQTAFFLPGSVRLNMSVSGAQTDEAMMAALDKVGLWNLIASRGGFESSMSAIALSHGQEQLFCLATAMLRKSRIVVMDEATSGVDEDTEKRIDGLIKEEFRDCTIINVAHRLKKAVDSDLVVVMSQGTCVEIGEPTALLESRGIFWQLTKA